MVIFKNFINSLGNVRSEFLRSKSCKLYIIWLGTTWSGDHRIIFKCQQSSKGYRERRILIISNLFRCLRAWKSKNFNLLIIFIVWHRNKIVFWFLKSYVGYIFSHVFDQYTTTPQKYGRKWSETNIWIRCSIFFFILIGKY